MNSVRMTGWQRAWSVIGALGAGLVLAGVAVASEAGGHGGGPGISPEKITDFTWRTVNFLVFAAILFKLVAKPAKNFFAKRSTDIAATLEEVEAKKAAAELALKEAETRLAEVAKEREGIVQQYIKEGELEKSKILDKANQVAERIREMASLSIQTETKKAAQSLKEEVVDLATKLATDALKEKATFADQQGLVEEYLQKVVNTH
jgi:F-type H+-transporting ATPase subunit b